MLYAVVGLSNIWGYGQSPEVFCGVARSSRGAEAGHLLEEVLLISIAAGLSGAESWNDIADYGNAKLEGLKTFLTLPSGIGRCSLVGDLAG